MAGTVQLLEDLANLADLRVIVGAHLIQRHDRHLGVADPPHRLVPPCLLPSEVLDDGVGVLSEEPLGVALLPVLPARDLREWRVLPLVLGLRVLQLLHPVLVRAARHDQVVAVLDVFQPVQTQKEAVRVVGVAQRVVGGGEGVMECGDPLLTVEHEVVRVGAVGAGLYPGHRPKPERHVLPVGFQEEQRPYVVSAQQGAQQALNAAPGPHKIALELRQGYEAGLRLLYELRELLVVRACSHFSSLTTNASF
jgi:hypothetical protein